MYAHVNIWRLNDAGAQSDDSAARAMSNRLREQPGFRSYTLVRTGEREVVAVVVFDSKEQLDCALEDSADIVRQRISQLTEGDPQRRSGEVLHHATA